MISNNRKYSHKNRHLSGLAFMLVLAVLLQSFLFVNTAKAAVTSNLTGTYLINGTQITLNWNDYLTGEIQYIIEKKIDSGSFASIDYAPSNYTSRTVGIDANRTNTYRVKVIDSTNTTYIYTNEITINPNDIKTPDSLTVTPVSYDQIDLKWTYPDKQAYNTIIERRVENDTNWYQLARVGIGQNTYSDKAIASGIKYYYRVRQYYSDNIITPYYPLNDSGGTYSLLYKPTNLYGYAISQNQIQLKWQDNSVETAFIIERRSPDEGVFKEIAAVPANTVGYVDTVTQAGIVFAYRVKAVTGNTSSEYSDVASVTSTYLRTPAALSSTTSDGNSVTLSWQDLTDGETGFEIWRKAGTDGVWTLNTTMGRNTSTYTDLSVSPQTAYTYKIRAKINDNSVYSDFSNETTIWTSSISAPANLTCKIVTKSAIELTWEDKSSVEAGFIVEKRTGLTGQWYQISFLDANTTSFSDKWVNSNDITCYRIKVYDRSNAVNYSNEVIVTMKTPEAPTNLQTAVMSSSDVYLTWRDNCNFESGFVIEAKQLYAFKEIGRVSANTTAFIHKGAVSGKSITYRVRALNGSIESSNSNDAVATTKGNVTYTDLASVGWAVDAINNLASRNVFNAKANTRFYPSQNITRGEYCAILVRSLELGKTAAGRFADVTSKHKYYNEIMIAQKFGIIAKDKYNKIYPDKLITREQAGIMLALALKAKGTPLPANDSSVLKQFADYRSVSDASAANIAAVCGAGIMTGRTIQGKNYLQLSSCVTRAEAAVMAYKALNLQ